ncbi:NUDIX domain-containing protein [Paracidovorax wautersii]|uniref:ADP-ribose pyrophosphatase YjhB, NUDIX family n=1 Tax=Paracidovorax wautersii TaxID=1177982 RepID=A0A1I2HYP9_9BURK|nr:NUDIX domain-containing protein [Paracidovorax wautersii]SFF33766.1 ADP-ribose pyrophosphatase YjhB, NUDIX family [Paracidovorax wautersii]
MSGKAFDEWFHVQGLRDPAGEPLVLYHGAKHPDALTSFTPGGPVGAALTGDAYGVASYFTTSAGEAAAYIGESGAVFPVYVRGELLDVDGTLTSEQQERLTLFANEHLLPSDRARFSMGRKRRELQDLAEAREFFDTQMENWRHFGDGMERAKPEVLSNDPTFVVEYTDFDAPVAIQSGDDAFTLFRAVGWDNLIAAGFDGMRMRRDGGQSWVVMHRTDGNVKSAIGNDGSFNHHSADIRFSELPDEGRDTDDGHGAALVETGFWGRAGAGSVVVARSTGRVLLPLRSEAVLEPGTWGTWGGAIDPGEQPAAAAQRELVEEAGLDPSVPVDMVPLMVFQSGDFRYHNFAAVVDEEFQPTLNWESDASLWCDLDGLPFPLHPGLQALMKDAKSVEAIRAQGPKLPSFTGEFLRWIEGTVVVDRRMQPMKVFHGSAASVIERFRIGGDSKLGHGQQMPAIYFTPLRATAQAYARAAVNDLDASRADEGTVHEAYVALRHPRRYTEVDEFATADRAQLIAAGHDGAVRLNAFGEVVEIAVFEPSQVRLAKDAEFGVHATKDSMRRAIAEIVKMCPEDLPSSIVVTTADELRATEAQERQQAFDRWFGDSKVVDDQRRPLVVYHGTRVGGITAFRDGGWFADSEVAARQYGEVIYEAYLRIELPATNDDLAELFSEFKGRRFDEDEDGPSLRDLAFYDEEFHRFVKDAGHDGLIVYDDSMDIETTAYVPFEPTQIKSATGNHGAYDPADPDIRHSLNAGQDLGRQVQAWHDPSSNTTVFLADRIPAGREAAVFLHETVHRHGRSVLPERTFDQLVGQVHTWAQRSAGTVEREIYGAAARRVAMARVSGPAADEELFAYAVEEAVARGVQPSAAAAAGSAQAWLQAVVESIQRIGEKLIGNALQGLDGQDLVDLAYALAQVENSEHGQDVRRSLQELSFSGMALLATASHINGTLRLPGVVADVMAERGAFVSIYEWRGDGTGRTPDALEALQAFGGGNVVVHDAGEPGSDALRYWQLMQSRGLVRTLLDDLGAPVLPVEAERDPAPMR